MDPDKYTLFKILYGEKDASIIVIIVIIVIMVIIVIIV